MMKKTTQRNTRQRRAIEEIFEEAERPLNPEEILARSKAKVAGIGQATVYRTISSFLEEKKIVPVEIPGHASRYEKASLKHHHHFACTECSKVYELPGCPYNGKANVPNGFTVSGHEVILYGQCKTCQ